MKGCSSADVVGLLQLPFELLLFIFDLAYHPDHNPHDCLDVSMIKSLDPLEKAFMQTVLKEVTFPRVLTPFFESILADSEACSHVRHLSMYAPRGVSVPLKSFPNLASVHVTATSDYFVSLRKTSLPFPPITKVHLVLPYFHAIPWSRVVIDHLQLLQPLPVEDLQFAVEGFKDLKFNEKLSLRSVKRLTLIIRDFIPQWSPDIYALFPNLDSLELRVIDRLGYNRANTIPPGFRPPANLQKLVLFQIGFGDEDDLLEIFSGPLKNLRIVHLPLIDWFGSDDQAAIFFRMLGALPVSELAIDYFMIDAKIPLLDCLADTSLFKCLKTLHLMHLDYRKDECHGFQALRSIAESRQIALQNYTLAGRIVTKEEDDEIEEAQSANMYGGALRDAWNYYIPDDD